jgi:hypothetical protein
MVVRNLKWECHETLPFADQLLRAGITIGEVLVLHSVVYEKAEMETGLQLTYCSVAAHMLIGQMFDPLLNLIIFVLTSCHASDPLPYHRKHV